MKSFVLFAALITLTLAGCISPEENDPNPEPILAEGPGPSAPSSTSQSSAPQNRPNATYSEEEIPTVESLAYFEVGKRIRLTNEAGALPQLLANLELTQVDATIIGGSGADYELVVNLLGVGGTEEEARTALQSWNYLVEERAGSSVEVYSYTKSNQTGTLVCNQVFVVRSCTGSTVRGNLTLIVPASILVNNKVSSGSGDVIVANIIGNFGSYSLGSGEAEIDASAFGTLAVETGSGDITFANGRATSATLESGSGDHLIENAKFDSLTSSTGSGDAVIQKTTAAKFSRTSGSGSTYGEFAGLQSISGEAGSGDFGLELIPNPQLQGSVKTSSGDIDVELSFSAWIAAKTSSGDIEFNWNDANRIADGEKSKEWKSKDYDSSARRSNLSLTTSSGDILVAVQG